MSKLAIQKSIKYLSQNPFLLLRIIILAVSLSSLISAFSYLLVYIPEVYVRGVPFSAVLKSLAFGGLLTVIERFVRIYEEIEENIKKQK